MEQHCIMSTESSSANKWVFNFTEGDGKNKKLLGGKGANLCEMTQIGLNVPPGFVISTEACKAYMRDGWPDGLDDELRVQRLVDSAGSAPRVVDLRPDDAEDEL